MKFTKIFVEEAETGNLIDITDLSLDDYEYFLSLIKQVDIKYREAKKEYNMKVTKEEVERFRENLIKGLPLNIQEGFRNPLVNKETNPQGLLSI